MLHPIPIQKIRNAKGLMRTNDMLTIGNKTNLNTMAQTRADKHPVFPSLTVLRCHIIHCPCGFPQRQYALTQVWKNITISHRQNQVRGIKSKSEFVSPPRAQVKTMAEPPYTDEQHLAIWTEVTKVLGKPSTGVYGSILWILYVRVAHVSTNTS